MKKLLVVFLVPLLAASATAVCAVPQPRLICAEYFHSDVVVVAKLTHANHLTPRNAQDGYIYKLHTAKVLRGKIDPSFSIYEENSSGRATFDWQGGRSYLLFLTFDQPSHAWVLDGCGNSGPLKESAMALKAIDRIQTGRKGGLIQGVVVSYFGSDAKPGATIQVRGSNQRFRTTTNDNGEFRIHVPAGEYTVHAESKGWFFSEGDLSYEDPKSIRIENGGCAQAQFRGAERVK